jgi:DNA-binding NarL/FixJ family response regulator
MEAFLPSNSHIMINIDKKATILIVDDHKIVNDSLSSILSLTFDISGQITDYDKVEQAVFSYRPDVILMDINLRGKSSFELIPHLIKIGFNSQNIIFLSMYNDQYFLQKAKELNVGGYVLKDSSTSKLIKAINLVLDGEKYFDKYEETEVLKDDFQKENLLTPRETEIVRLIKDGYTTEKIADRLSVSYETIKSHRKNIFNKLEFTKVNQLIEFAIKNKI